MSNSATKTCRQVSRSKGAIFIACAAMALLIAAIAAFAAPDKAYAYGFKSTSSTTNSITVTWDDPFAGYSSYKSTAFAVAWADATEANDASKMKTQVLGANQRSFTLTGLKAGTKYAIALACSYTINSNPASSPRVFANDSFATRVVKPTGVKQTKWSYKDNRAYFTWDIQTGAIQTQCKLINAKNGKTIKTLTTGLVAKDFYVYNMSKTYAYAVQMRVKDSHGWSPWSAKMYFVSQPLTTSATKVSKGKMTVAWNKVNGAQKYSVYVSTKAKTGYKKVATVSSSKSKTTLKKFSGKKFNAKKTYYVYVQATKKVGGKTFTSGKHYAYKVKGAKGSMKYPF